MNEKVTKYYHSVKTFWEKQTKKKRITILSVIGGIIVLSLVVTLLLNIKGDVVLYGKLDKDEEVEVIKILQSASIDFKYGKNGEILVPEEKEAAIRMQLAGQGYPRTAPNYDLFKDNIDVMTTDFEKREWKKNQLNERLADSIKTIDGVDGAIVTISIPDTNGYVWDEKEDPPTASVALKLRAGIKLEPTQVNGIEQLVAKSVPGMTAENVIIVDGTGNELKSSGEMSYVDVNKFKLEIQNQYQDEIEKNVLKILEPTFGKNNVIVSAKTDMNLDKKIQEIITYSQDKDDKVIVEESTQSEKVDGDKQGGVAGENENTDVPQYDGVTTDGKNIYVKDNKTYKYLVSQIKEQIEHDTAEVKDLTVAISVNKAELDAVESERLSQLVAHAAGIQTDKISIYNSLFNDYKKPGAIDGVENPFTKNIFFYSIIAGAALVFIIALLILILVLKGKKKKKKKFEFVPVQQVEEEMFDPEQISIDLNKKRDTKEQAMKEGIRDFSSQNPEIVAQLIKTWLRGDND